MLLPQTQQDRGKLRHMNSCLSIFLNKNTTVMRRWHIFYQFILSEKQGGRGILAVQGGEDEDSKGEAQHYDVLTFCTSADHFEVECIQIDSLDGNNILTQKVVLMEGKVERRKEHEHDGGCEEKISSQVDSLAEGVWNCYFGRYSRWHHKGGDVQG